MARKTPNVRKAASPERTAELCRQVRSLDHALMNLVETFQSEMSLRAADELVRIQKRLRVLRYQIEAEAQAKSME